MYMKISTVPSHNEKKNGNFPIVGITIKQNEMYFIEVLMKKIQLFYQRKTKINKLFTFLNIFYFENLG